MENALGPLARHSGRNYRDEQKWKALDSPFHPPGSATAPRPQPHRALPFPRSLGRSRTARSRLHRSRFRGPRFAPRGSLRSPLGHPEIPPVGRNLPLPVLLRGLPLVALAPLAPRSRHSLPAAWGGQEACSAASAAYRGGLGTPAVPGGLIRSVVTIYRYDRVTDAIDPEQTYNRPYERANHARVYLVALSALSERTE